MKLFSKRMLCLQLQGTYEKGAKDEIEEFIYRLLDVSGDGIVGR